VQDAFFPKVIISKTSCSYSDTLEEFLRGFPSVTRQQAEAVIELAAAKLLSEIAA